MIGSVTEFQQDMAAIEKRRSHLRGQAAKGGAVPESAHGPGRPMEPGEMDPGDFARPYVSEGHAAASSQHDPPNSNPMPRTTPGFRCKSSFPARPWPREFPTRSPPPTAAAARPTADPRREDPLMTLMYARNDVMSINVGEAHGGCGKAHHREVGENGYPVMP